MILSTEAYRCGFFCEQHLGDFGRKMNPLVFGEIWRCTVRDDYGLLTERRVRLQVLGSVIEVFDPSVTGFPKSWHL